MAPAVGNQGPAQITIFSGCFVHSDDAEDMVVLPEMVLGLSGAKIIFFEPSEKLPSLFKNYNMSEDRVVELKHNQFFMPGFVDSHAHASQYSFMGTGSDLELLPWLQTYTYPTESKISGDAEFAKNVYGKCVARTLKQGTTTSCYFATIDRQSTMYLVEAVESQGQRAYIGKVNMDTNAPDFYQETCETSLSETVRFVEEVQKRKNPLITPCITPRFAITCSMELMKSLAQLAKDKSLPIQTHISENHGEIEAVRDIFKDSPNYASVYDSAGLLGPKTILAHGVHLTDEELDLIKTRATGISHCPNSNISLFSGTLDVRRLLEANVKVGLGTDYAGGHSPSMLDAIRRGITAANITAERMRTTGLPVKPVTYKTMFRLATLGSSEVLGLENQIGNFKVGKEFDAILVDTSVKDSPFDVFPTDTLNDVIQKFLFMGDDRNIVSVYVAGKEVLTSA